MRAHYDILFSSEMPGFNVKATAGSESAENAFTGVPTRNFEMLFSVSKPGFKAKANADDVEVETRGYQPSWVGILKSQDKKAELIGRS
jgi:hypothetical protein